MATSGGRNTDFLSIDDLRALRSSLDDEIYRVIKAAMGADGVAKTYYEKKIEGLEELHGKLNRAIRHKRGIWY